MATKKKSKKKPSVEMTLWDVILSYPDLHDPKPFKGKIYYRTDCLMDEDHPQLADLRAAIKSVKVKAFGTDKSEWPEMKNFIQDGNAREDQKGYADKKYITVSTQTPVPVIDLKDKPFNPQSVKGGMFANVAIRISAWEYDGDEGVSIYLQGVQIDTSKASLNFGGGKSVKQMFKRDDDDSEDESDEDTEADESDEDEDDQPRKSKSKKRKAADEDEDDVGDEEEDEAPRKSKAKKKKPIDDEDEDDTDADESDEDEDDAPPKKKKKRPARDDDEDEEE